MKKLILAGVLIFLVVVVIAGGLWFDNHKQNQKISGIESRLDLISDMIESKNLNGVQNMLNQTNIELIELSDRWISTRKLRAQDRVAQLRVKAKNQPTVTNSTNSADVLPSLEELKKTVQEASNQMNKEKK